MGATRSTRSGRSAEPEVALEVRFDEPATPARVMATARFFQAILDAADPSLPDGSVTLVVSNFLTVAGVRAWNQAGRDAVSRCERYLKDPVKESRNRPASRRVAGAFLETAPGIAEFSPRVTKPRQATPLAVVDKRAVIVARDIVEKMSAPKTERAPLLGTTEIRSQIYRIGRLDDGKEIRARVRVNERAVDVVIDRPVVDAAFDAAKSMSAVSITVEGRWIVMADGGLVLDGDGARIVRIGSARTTISGAEFLAAVEATAPDVFSDLEDILPQSKN